MNLRHCISQNKPFQIPCVKCHTPVWFHHAYADLDGKPFEDYYCAPCAMQLQPSAFNRPTTTGATT